MLKIDRQAKLMTLSKCIALLLLTALPIAADEVFLKNGRVLDGTVVERTDTQVVIDVAAGRLSLPMSMIERVESSASEVSEYQRRADGLAADDVAGWLRLGFWAKDERLDTKSRDAFAKVFATDPGNILAREVLGVLGSNDGADAETVARPAGATRQAFDREWSGALLAPGDEAVAQRLDRALSLARYGRWAEAAWRLREAGASASLQGSLFDTVLFAVDVAANSSNEAIEGLFTSEEVLFERLGCVLSLKFVDTEPRPWEWVGEAPSSGQSVDLSGDVQLALVLPFRRVGQRQHLATTDALDTPTLFEGRLIGAPGSRSLALTWRTQIAGEAEESYALLQLEAAADGGWGEVRSQWKGGVANYRKHRDLPTGFFTERRFVRAKVESERISFDVDGGLTESLALPTSELIFLELQGAGERVAFDWISLSGPLDGLWLARRLGERALAP